jgi:hypothetical protein
MNWRPLLPCAGLLGGALAGWQMRESGTAGAASVVVEDWKTAQTAFVVPATSRAPAVMKLSELHNLWSADGTVGIYELLDSVPPATLAAWLDEMMPPETHSRSVEREKREGIRTALVERLAERDPAALAEWLIRVPAGQMAPNWLKPGVHALLERNPPNAVALLKQLEKANRWTTEFRLEWLTKRDPAAAFQQLLASPKQDPPDALARWIAADPARCLAFANEHPDRCVMVLYLIGEQGSAALREIAAGLTAPEAQRQARRMLLTAAARDGDAETIAQYFKKEGRNSDDSLPVIAIATLARQHPEKARAMAQEFSGQSALVNEILGRLATSHPEHIATMLASPEQRELLTWHPLNNMAQIWSLSDPAAAQAWLRGLPQDQLVKALPYVDDIADDLPDAEWLELSRGLPVNSERANGLAWQMVARTTEPAVLADWCASFPDGTREHILHRLRENLRDDQLADDVARRVLAAIPPDTP